MTHCLKILTILLLGWLATNWLPGHEVQHHGLIFEKWIRDTFFDGYQPAHYTAKWDIPASANQRFGNIPVNPKAIRYGAPVGMGDALRQFDIDEPYMLIVGYWEQRGPKKHFIKVIAPRIDPELQRKLWHPITRKDLEELDALIKNRDLPITVVRKKALAIKNRPPFSEAIMQIHPKIDSHGQRRLQASIRFQDVFRYLVPDISPDPEEHPKLFGVPVIGPIYSPPRRLPSAQTEHSQDDSEDSAFTEILDPQPASPSQMVPTR